MNNQTTIQIDNAERLINSLRSCSIVTNSAEFVRVEKQIKFLYQFYIDHKDEE